MHRFRECSADEEGHPSVKAMDGGNGAGPSRPTSTFLRGVWAAPTSRTASVQPESPGCMEYISDQSHDSRGGGPSIGHKHQSSALGASPDLADKAQAGPVIPRTRAKAGGGRADRLKQTQVRDISWYGKSR